MKWDLRLLSSGWMSGVVMWMTREYPLHLHICSALTRFSTVLDIWSACLDANSWRERNVENRWMNILHHDVGSVLSLAPSFGVISVPEPEFLKEYLQWSQTSLLLHSMVIPPPPLPMILIGLTCCRCFWCLCWCPPLQVNVFDRNLLGHVWQWCSQFLPCIKEKLDHLIS